MSDTRPQDPPDEAMVDLLIKQVTEGLSPAEQRALDVLDSEVASAYSRDLERAAAAVALAGSSTPQPLPAALAERVAQQAAAHFASPSKIGDLGAARVAAVDAKRTSGSSVPSVSSARPVPRANRFGGYGWLAAAACLVLAIFGWVRSPTPPPLVQTTPPSVLAPPQPPPAPPAPPTPAEERAALLAKSDALKIPLAATKDPAAVGVTGDVVWDPATQRGFLHFTGLAANAPAVHQYYYADQGPAYTGPGNFAPYPTYREGGWGYRHHRHHYGYDTYPHYGAWHHANHYGYGEHHNMRYGAPMGMPHHYGYREHTLRRYY